MPYIRDRIVFDPELKLLTQKLRAIPQDSRAGCLNYIISSLCSEGMTKLNYDGLNSVIGALEAAKLELYRRLAAPYEDIKIKENGDLPIYAAIARYPGIQKTEGNTPGDTGENSPGA